LPGRNTTERKLVSERKPAAERSSIGEPVLFRLADGARASGVRAPRLSRFPAKYLAEPGRVFAESSSTWAKPGVPARGKDLWCAITPTRRGSIGCFSQFTGRRRRVAWSA